MDKFSRTDHSTHFQFSRFCTALNVFLLLGKSKVGCRPRERFENGRQPVGWADRLTCRTAHGNDGGEPRREGAMCSAGYSTEQGGLNRWRKRMPESPQSIDSWYFFSQTVRQHLTRCVGDG